MGEIQPKTCEGRELTKNQLERSDAGRPPLAALGETLTSRLPIDPFPCPGWVRVGLGVVLPRQLAEHPECPDACFPPGLPECAFAVRLAAGLGVPRLSENVGRNICQQ